MTPERKLVLSPTPPTILSGLIYSSLSFFVPAILLLFRAVRAGRGLQPTEKS